MHTILHYREFVNDKKTGKHIIASAKAVYFGTPCNHSNDKVGNRGMNENTRGGKRRGAGRKKGSTTGGTGYKTGRIVISCLESEEAEIRCQAAANGKTVSRYLVELALK